MVARAASRRWFALGVCRFLGKRELAHSPVFWHQVLQPLIRGSRSGWAGRRGVRRRPVRRRAVRRRAVRRRAVRRRAVRRRGATRGGLEERGGGGGAGWPAAGMADPPPRRPSFAPGTAARPGGKRAVAACNRSAGSPQTHLQRPASAAARTAPAAARRTSPTRAAAHTAKASKRLPSV